MDGAPPPASPAGLSVYVAVSQLLGLTLLATTGAWLGRYRGGVAWHSPLQFNAHPLCMVLGMVFLQGDGEQDGGTPALSQLQPPEPGAALGQGVKGTKDTGKVCQHLWAVLGDSCPLSVQLCWCTGCSGTKPSAPPGPCTPCSTAWRCSSPSWVSAGLSWLGWAGGSPGADGLLSSGIIAVFESHRAKGISDMYSLHSWCGMATFVLYLLQVRGGKALMAPPVPSHPTLQCP